VQATPEYGTEAVDQLSYSQDNPQTTNNYDQGTTQNQDQTDGQTTDQGSYQPQPGVPPQ
jgi:hypothetical protein